MFFGRNVDVFAPVALVFAELLRCGFPLVRGVGSEDSHFDE